jgi:AcrR family transcriptional regulator
MTRRISREAPTREQFIHGVLHFVERGVSLRQVNLRRLARHVGCAHTNAYNYFASLQELFWYALDEALHRMVAYSEPTSDPAAAAAPEPFIASHVQFAIDHPGLYRFIWLDSLTGDPPSDVAEYLAVPGQLFRRALAEAAGLATSEPAVVRGVRMVHGYLHGELCSYVAQRLPADDPAALRRELVANGMLLFRELVSKAIAV